MIPIKDMKTQGIIRADKEKKLFEIAVPVGLIMGIVPSTNPTSTAMFKSIIAVKARNSIVFSPHPSACKCTLRAAELMMQAAEEAGAPKGTIGCLRTPTMEATNELMHHKDVKLIIATGGPGMVKAAYSAGQNRRSASVQETHLHTSKKLQMFMMPLNELWHRRPLITAPYAPPSSRLFAKNQMKQRLSLN